MLSSLKTTITHAIPTGIFHGHHNNELHTHHVRLKPTGRGYFYLVLISIMLISSLNYQNNLGILTSLFFFICLVFSGLQTRSLLQDIRFNINKIEPVFCNTPAHALITITTTGDFDNAQLHLHTDISGDRTVHLNAAQQQSFNYAIPTQQRGEHIIHQINLNTIYPFGVLKATAIIDCELHFIVYPDPALTQHQSTRYAQDPHYNLQDFNQSDFAGMRTYTPGDPFKLINWKTAAKTSELYVNLYSATTHNDAWIDWDDYSGIDIEQRLSLMTRAVIDHETVQSNYGLRLPGKHIRPNFGMNHMKQCLTALACYNISYLDSTPKHQP